MHTQGICKFRIWMLGLWHAKHQQPATLVSLTPRCKSQSLWDWATLQLPCLRAQRAAVPHLGQVGKPQHVRMCHKVSNKRSSLFASAEPRLIGRQLCGACCMIDSLHTTGLSGRRAPAVAPQTLHLPIAEAPAVRNTADGALACSGLCRPTWLGIVKHLQAKKQTKTSAVPTRQIAKKMT
jgi:hypothetical protein